MPIFRFNSNFIFNSFSVASFSIYIFLLNNFIFLLLCCVDDCNVNTHFVWTLISFSISFSVTSFSISIFVFNNFILYYLYCCVDDCNVDTHAIILLCQHSCQYSVWTLISFLISFSLLHFPFLFFYNFILYYFCCYFYNCNVDTHANIQPRGQLSVHMYCYTDWLYSCWVTVHFLYITEVTNQRLRNLLRTDRHTDKATHRARWPSPKTHTH